MITELKIQTTEMTITPNSDGTHRIRIVGHGADPLEFTCDLQPFLAVAVELDSSQSLVSMEGEVVVSRLNMHLQIAGSIRPDVDHRNYTTRILARDDCGRDRR